MYSSRQLDPPPRPQNLRPDQPDGNQRDDADPVSPGHDIDQPVVVDQRDYKHQQQPNRQEADLFRFETMELGVQRGRLDLEDADQREQQDEAQENPVKVTI